MGVVFAGAVCREGMQIPPNSLVAGVPARILRETFQCRERPELWFAGQISGVEGYVESAAMGLLAGINAARQVLAQPLITPPRETALGALINHLTNTATKDFQPMNVNFGLFPPLVGRIPKKLRGAAYAERALGALHEWMNREGQASAGRSDG